MRSRRWRSFPAGPPEPAHGSPELVKHALLAETDSACAASHPRGAVARALSSYSGSAHCPFSEEGQAATAKLRVAAEREREREGALLSGDWSGGEWSEGQL
jgi:hypothetical protein